MKIININDIDTSNIVRRYQTDNINTFNLWVDCVSQVINGSPVVLDCHIQQDFHTEEVKVVNVMISQKNDLLVNVFGNKLDRLISRSKGFDNETDRKFDKRFFELKPHELSRVLSIVSSDTGTLQCLVGKIIREFHFTHNPLVCVSVNHEKSRIYFSAYGNRSRNKQIINALIKYIKSAKGAA